MGTMKNRRRETRLVRWSLFALVDRRLVAMTIVGTLIVVLSTGGRTWGQADKNPDQKGAAAKDIKKKDSSAEKPADAAKGKSSDPFTDELPDAKPAAPDKSAGKSDEKQSSPMRGTKTKTDARPDKDLDDPFANTPPAKKADLKPAFTDPFPEPKATDSKTPAKTTKHSDNPFEEKEPGKLGDAKSPDDTKPQADSKPLPDTKPLTDTKTSDAGPHSSADLLKDTRSTEPEATPGQAELKKGQDLLDAAKYAEAIAPLKEAIKKAPTDAGPGTADAAHNALGIAYRMLSRYDDAIEEFSEALKLNTELGDAFFRRGICWYYKDEYPLAQADFEDAAATTTTDRERTRPLTWKGMSLARQGLVRDAVNVYSEALRYDNAYAAAHINRGLAYLSLKEYPKAIGDFDQAIRSTPKDASLYFKRGVAESGSGNWAAAVKSYSEAIRLNPKYSDAYGNRSLAYRRIGDTAKSQADAEKSQQLKADADRAKQSASAR
jgi:tetratricopeptide (TPR) repeat protein